MSEAPQTLKSAITELAHAVERTVLYFDKLDPTNVPALLDAYRAIHEQAELLDNLNTLITAVKHKVSYEIIPAQFEAMQIDSIKSKGRNYIIGTRLNASIPLAKRDKGFAYLKSVGLDPLIASTVNPKSLSSAIAQLIETTGIDPPEDCMTIHKQKYTSIRKV